VLAEGALGSMHTYYELHMLLYCPGQTFEHMEAMAWVVLHTASATANH
jgi:hypothetical protein